MFSAPSIVPTPLHSLAPPGSYSFCYLNRDPDVGYWQNIYRIKSVQQININIMATESLKSNVLNIHIKVKYTFIVPNIN